MASDLFPVQPVFILSPQRSGSTLLRFILDAHPEIDCPPELFTGQVVRSWVMFHLALRGVGSASVRGGRWHVADEIREPLRALILSRLAEHARSRGKVMWCDKSTNNIEHVGLLDAVFPEARYLCLHRHCLDVVASARRFAGSIAAIQAAIYRSGGDLLAGTIRWWCEVTNNLLALEEEHPERSFRLRYEDLVQAPAVTLEPLFQFLGVSWDPALPELAFSTHHEEGVGDPKIWFENRIHDRSLGAGRDLALDGVPAPILDEMRALLGELGYRTEPAVAPAPATPAPVVDIAWLLEHHLLEQLRQTPDLLGRDEGPIRFAVAGDGGGVWQISRGSSSWSVERLSTIEPGDLRISAEHLRLIATGRLNAYEAHLRGHLRLASTASEPTLHRLVRALLLPQTSYGFTNELSVID